MQEYRLYGTTVDILTMHNAGPQLFLCIVTFYARRNVSQSVTIRDICQKCHTTKIITVVCIKKFRGRFHEIFASDCQDQGYDLFDTHHSILLSLVTQKHGQTPF